MRDACSAASGFGRPERRQCLVLGASPLQPDEPVAFTGTPTGDPGRAGNTVQVTKRQVHVTIDIEIVDQQTGRTLWVRRSLTRTGDYDPGRESEGRRKALELLVNDIVDGAQQQW